MTRSERKFATMFDFADQLAELATCRQANRKVGVVIFPMSCSEVYAIGYNGAPRGHPNNACMNVQGECGCAHAEGNALVACNPGRMLPSVLFTTMIPCQHCAALICNCLPIAVVVYDAEYRSTIGLNCIQVSGIEMIHRSRVHDVTIHKWRALSSRGR